MQLTNNSFQSFVKYLVIFSLALIFSGCGAFDSLLKIGPDSVEDGRGQFNNVIAETNDQQLLLNLVKRRYGDNIALLEINSVSTTLEWKRGGGLALNIFDGDDNDSNNLGINANGAYTERPTITYLPVKGPELIKKVLSPLDPDVLILLSRSGWRMDRVMRLTLNTINDIDNASSASGPTPLLAPNPEEFNKLLSVIEKLGRGNFQLGYTLINNQRVLALSVKKAMVDSPEMQDLIDVLDIDKHLLYIVNTDANSDYRSGSEIDINLRSLAGIEFYLSHGIHIPEEHLKNKNVQISYTAEGDIFNWNTIFEDTFQVYSAIEEPSDNLAAVKVYWRGYWFFINDTDINSKYTFMLLNQISALQSGDVDKSGPLLTLPVN